MSESERSVCLRLAVKIGVTIVTSPDHHPPPKQLNATPGKVSDSERRITLC